MARIIKFRISDEAHKAIAAAAAASGLSVSAYVRAAAIEASAVEERKS